MYNIIFNLSLQVNVKVGKIPTDEQRLNTDTHDDDSDSTIIDGSNLQENPEDSKVKKSIETKRKCQYCEETFLSVHLKYKHEKTAHQKLWTSCLICNKNFHSRAVQRLHMLKHQEKNFACLLCEKKFVRLDRLERHRVLHPGFKVHKDVEVYELKPVNTNTRENNADLGENHEDTKGLKKTHSCQFCGRQYSTKKCWESHLKTIHNWESEKPYECNECENKFKVESKLLYHRTKVHNDPGPFACSVCSKEYTKPDALIKHKVSRHSGKKNFKCKKCGERFTTAKLRAEHKLNAHAGDIYMCELCGKEYPKQSALNRHIDVFHLKTEVCKCDECGKVFQTGYCLKAHMKIHTGSNTFICDICGRIFKTKTALKIHVVRHDKNAVGKYTCEFCGRKFFKSSNLLNHIRRHKGIKLFACDVCGKSFVESCALVRHMRIHTGEKPYSCDVCGMRFNQSGTVKLHKKKQHPNVIGCLKQFETMNL